jgi:excisionase family DNA binding protein
MTRNTERERAVRDATPLSERLALRPLEAAAMLGISRASLYREMQAGRLPKRKAGGRTLIATEDARAWLERAAERRDAEAA